MPTPRKSTATRATPNPSALNGSAPLHASFSPAAQRGSAARRPLAAVVASITLLALLLQFLLMVHTQRGAGRGLAYAALVFFGFFTILTNLLCALITSAHLVRSRRHGTGSFFRQPWLITSAAASIAIVGSVYFLVLRRLWQPTGLQLWVDAALHYAVPLLFLVFWWSVTPPRWLRWNDLPRMLLYPLAYLVYVFARGAVTSLYPYFFIDVTTLGYPASLRNTLAVVLAFLAITSILIAINRRRHA